MFQHPVVKYIYILYLLILKRSVKRSFCTRVIYRMSASAMVSHSYAYHFIISDALFVAEGLIIFGQFQFFGGNETESGIEMGHGGNE